ncbi:MAG: VWA domain-containing protein [Deltaproteobacteria bacterium]|nr:VWA domain-containing protein [Deltaproteobacteria bacterium]
MSYKFGLAEDVRYTDPINMFQFANTDNLIWFALLPLIIGLWIYGQHQKQRSLNLYADLKTHGAIGNQFSPPKQWIRTFLIFGCLTLLILTLMRPQGNPEVQTIKKRGRDLVFVIDVSRSMLAEDLAPNRLGKAKQLVRDVVDILEGDRVGLLVFAGSSAIKSPLTLDYNYFKNVLDRISTADINRGGTLIGDAIRTVSERLFYDQDNKYRDVILITDGEDHESFPIEAAEEAAKRGIRIHTVGLGDPDGTSIPIRQSGTYTLLKYQEQPVKTRLDETTLKKIAAITKGVFIPVRTHRVDLADLYHNHIAVAEKREAESRQSKVWSELFQFFLGIAIIFLMAEAVLGERRIAV